jgi:hypothetical protein
MLAHFVNLVEELGASLGELFSAAMLKLADEDISCNFGFHVRRTSEFTLFETVTARL